MFSYEVCGCSLKAQPGTRRRSMRECKGSETGNHGTKREKDSGVTRREFLELGVAATLAAGAEELTWGAENRAALPQRTPGATGQKNPIEGLGASTHPLP